ncbi:endo alpha-1,4 polygalactosaminidase [Devosia sp. Leaf420]|uniref:endo alpha-1,4 polygalactosaminidase n=1 Tax=Devosia sp. Leaf420 TaxID=1736374 RepID=UPI0009EA0FC1|nr:endo alpha-1,4 polygalactosaminidase [Devosia sp. Leaf420]
MRRLALVLLACLSSASVLAKDFPAAGAQYDSQLGGAYTPPAGTRIVSRDRSEASAPGLYNVCYVNAFQTQPGENAWWEGDHPDLILTADGRPVEDENWPGEYLLDTSTAAKRGALADIVGDWIEGCARDGYDAIEADNLDTYSRSDGRLKIEDNLAFVGLLIDKAHGLGLAFGQKNGVELLDRADLPAFDFAITESCQVYDECGPYAERYGARVLEIEYTDTESRFFEQACAARGGQFSIILRDRNLQPPGMPGYMYRSC